jgi:hypothetical protein
MPDDHMAWEEYRATIEKMASIHKSRTSREEEVEKALGISMPDLLRRLMDEYDGRKRPALKDLNGRLDNEGMNANVSSATFYDWLSKYHLRD